MKKFSLASMIVLMCSAAFAQSTVTLGPYLQKVTQTGIVIKWWTDDTTTTAKVMYGTDPNNLTLTATDATLSSRHSVSIGGLSPYTRYYYALYDGNTRLEGSADHTWRTFPAEGNDVPVRAWVIGDFGKGNEKQRRVHEAYTAYDTVG
ncbi:MAG: fibronectin type III domain-containing protein, partial [Bacteroidetes bacterium]|nr:fibronectin type III domain-containing protein [Bacteroidota bacterium]